MIRIRTRTSLSAVAVFFLLFGPAGCDSPTLPRIPPAVEEEDTGDVEEGMNALRYVPSGTVPDLAERSAMPFTAPVLESR